MAYTVNKPSAAKKRFTFVSELETQLFKVVSGGACELVSVSVTAGNSACLFRLVDSSSGQFIAGQPLPAYNLESGPSYGAEASNSFSPNLNQPMPFKNGLIIVIEQGEGSNAECTVTVN